MEKTERYTVPHVQPRTRGQLKIFFSYAAGAGKTRAMLQDAYNLQKQGTDVVVGWIEPHAWSDAEKLVNGLETLPVSELVTKGFDLDAALARKPQLILVEGLAHDSVPGGRHEKRYQDIEELLNAGINVYTTLNVQSIESLNDTVRAIMGVSEPERIPDSVFDRAEQVEMVDCDLHQLMRRMPKESKKSLTLQDLSALRELALRRCADHVDRESGGRGSNGEYQTEEHILVCLSSSPSNAKIIRTAARMAGAFKGKFTGLFVETPDFSAMSEEDLNRLRANMRLAEQLGAKIETVYGEDVSFQIAEFARLSGVSKIVIGRSFATKERFFQKQSLAETLIAHAPQLDIHIIPDSISGSAPYKRLLKRRNKFPLSVREIMKSVLILAVATGIGFVFHGFDFADANIITVYVLGVLVTSVVTTGRIYSLVSSLISVLVFNFLFTEPRLTFHAYDNGYPVTFLIMFLAALLTSTLADKLKEHAKKSALVAYRTKVLLDISQSLQQAKSRDAILQVTAHHLIQLMQKDVVVYTADEGKLSEPKVFFARELELPGQADRYCTDSERAVAQWVLQNNKHAGKGTQTFAGANCLYLAIRVNQRVHGVIGIGVGKEVPDTFEKSILLSILGECALALENEKNAREKEEAAILAKNEQLRANMLRCISHDLRTPLTSISGNASNFLRHEDSMDEQTKHQLFLDIYDDSMWLINLVENLLSITRLEENRLNLHIGAELVADVVAEALRHINRRSAEYHITVTHEDELLLAQMDARLIVQVIINLVDNAIKYTPAGSCIEIKTRAQAGQAVITVADNGSGIPDESKTKIFDMFYSATNQIADSRRSMGLGLALCKSIITAHGGQISVADHLPHGAEFTFTLPIGEVTIHE